MVLALLTLICGRAEGQQRGQWSWFGNASLLLSESMNPGSKDDGSFSSYERRTLAVALGIQGFIVDPLVSEFSLFVEPRWENYGYWNGNDVATNNWRYGGRILLFPRGQYSLFLAFNQDQYDTSRITTEDPVGLNRAPDTSSVLTGRFRIQGGVLRGLSVGAHRSTLEFVDSRVDSRVTKGQFVDWRRGSKNFSHHYNLTRRTYDYGSVSYRSDDSLLTGQENGYLGAAWTWDMSLIGRDRETETAGSGIRSFRTFRLFNRFVKNYSGGTSFRLTQTYAANQLDQSSTSHGLGLSAGYQWRLPTGFSLSTDASISHEVAGEDRLTAPSASVAGDWQRSWRKLTFSLDGLLSYAVLSREFGGYSTEETSLGVGGGGSIHYGETSKLETTLSAFWRRSDFQLTGEIDPEAPDLGVGLGRARLVDRFTARARLERRRQAYDILLTSNWSSYTPRGQGETSSAASESWVHSLTGRVGRLNLGAGAGQLEYRGVAIPYQSDFKYASFSFVPMSNLTVQGSYRTDHRDLWPNDVDLERMDLTFRFNIGDNVFLVQGYQISESAGSAMPRVTRGWMVTLSRGFRGWLPIASSVSGRGIVR